jgi:flavorubredoxin
MARIDEIVDGIYRISLWHPDYSITFNQFLIDDERPALVHTGMHQDYDQIRDAIREVMDPARLEQIILLHFEGDECGGMERFMDEAPQSQLVGSALSAGLNLSSFGLPYAARVQGMTDGDTLDLGRHKLRFLETPHVHHWDSMMVVDETTKSLFPSDLFIQPGEQPPVVSENLGDDMCNLYRGGGIFGHEEPVRRVVDRLEPMGFDWVHAMHGGTLTGDVFPKYAQALRDQDFAFQGMLLGRPLGSDAPVAEEAPAAP